MAVPEQIPVVNYIADGIVKKFDVPFEYDQQSDLHVYVGGAEPTIDKYFFSDNSFNFYIAPTSGQDVKIKRITPKERDTDYNLHTNTVRPKALNTDFDRLWYVLQEVFSDVGGLSQQVQDEIIARIQGDGDLLNQLTAEISARMLGDEAVTEDLKNYVNQVVGAIINDPDFDGIDADKVNDASGETQQQVNYNGGSKWHSRVGGYKLNERVVLTNGDIVKSTIDGNTNDPNVDMTGWRFDDNTVESIADLLAIPNPKNGSRINVKSYYSWENKGGDDFYYDSTKVAINNGVTIFNGWVRDLSDKILTTDDAGLIDNTGVDQKIKLQALADALQGTNSFTLKVTGKHLTSTNIIFNDAVGLRVAGNGEISAKELREQWSFKRTTGSRGVFLFEDCPYLTVDSNLKIVGAKKQYLTAPEPWEDGDCPIQLIRCPHALIQDGDFSHSIAWGVFAEGSPYTIVNNNDIYDVVRQSGVNIVIGGGTRCKVTNNRIRNVGLYGVEWETYNDCSDFEESGNVIWDCQKGSALVGHLINGSVHDNVYRFCNEGVTAYPLSQYEKTKNINVHDNQVFGCAIGLYAVQINDVLFYDNLVSMKIANDLYFKTSSYNSIVAVESSNQILVLPDSTFNIGSTNIDVKINNVQTVILSVVSITDNRLGTSTLKRLVLRDPIVGMQDGDFILRKRPIDGGYCGLYASGVNSNIIFKDNTVFNYHTAMKSDSNYATSDNQELFIDNKVFDCINFFVLPFVSQGVKVKNTYRQGGNIIIANQSIKSTLLPSASINVVNVESRSSGAGDNPIQYFSTIDNSLIVSCQIAFDSSFASSGSVVIKVDGSDAFTVPSSSFGSNKSFIDYNLLDLPAGNHSVQVVDTVGDLRYKSWSIKFNTV